MTTALELSAAVADFRALVSGVLVDQAMSGVTVIDGHPVRLEPGSLPAVVLDMVTIRRREPGEPDMQLGTWDWYLELPIEIYVAANEDVQNPAIASAHAEQLAAQVVCAIDGAPQMSNRNQGLLYEIVEAVISQAEPFVGALNGNDNEPVIGYEAPLHAFLLLPENL